MNQRPIEDKLEFSKPCPGAGPAKTPMTKADLFKKAHLILRAANHRLRQDILNLLANTSTKIGDEYVEGMAVTDLFVTLRLEQSVASQHLAILRKAGLVTTERRGKQIFYKTDEVSLASLCDDCISIFSITLF